MLLIWKGCWGEKLSTILKTHATQLRIQNIVGTQVIKYVCQRLYLFHSVWTRKKKCVHAEMKAKLGKCNAWSASENYFTVGYAFVFRGVQNTNTNVGSEQPQVNLLYRSNKVLSASNARTSVVFVEPASQLKSPRILFAGTLRMIVSSW